MPRIQKKYKKLFRLLPELTRLDGAYRFTGGQQDLLASNDSSVSGVKITTGKWKRVLEEDRKNTLKNQLERFIWQEIILEEWNRSKSAVTLSEVDKIMRKAGCPSLRSMIYGDRFGLFKNSYETIHKKFLRKIRREAALSDQSQKAP